MHLFWVLGSWIRLFVSIKELVSDPIHLISGATHLSCQTEVYSGSGHCYWQRTTKKTWSDALASCEADDGTLAVIYDKGTSDFIFNSFTLPSSWVNTFHSNFMLNFVPFSRQAILCKSDASELPSGLLQLNTCIIFLDIFARDVIFHLKHV